MNICNSYSDLEHLELVAQRLVESGKDITAVYGDWVKVAFACASLGEGGRESFHMISSVYPGYRREECDAKFDNCLRTGRGDVRIGTIMNMAKEAGVDVSLPRGRRARSDDEKAEDEKNRITVARDTLMGFATWRYDVWRQRTEMCESDGDWRPIQDRDIDTFYCRLREMGVKITSQDVRSIIASRDFSKDHDVVREWLEGLKPWNPDTDPDYLDEFYRGHLEFVDKETEDFCVEMLKKWHVKMVELMLGICNENPLMPILKGSQHIGKSYFARHILPPELRDLRIEVTPTQPIDKDFIISLSETCYIVFDEASFSSNQKNNAMKHIMTSERSNLRDAYARYREDRKRRASLIATTNEEYFIPDKEGTRRYLVVDIKGTVNLDQFPLPYEGAYAQAIYLIQNGFQSYPTQDESRLISQYNRRYAQTNDCEEAIATFINKPDTFENATSMTAGDILRELNSLGFRGRDINTNNIGRTMKKLEFESRIINGRRKYLVKKIDDTKHEQDNDCDVSHFIPQIDEDIPF